MNGFAIIKTNGPWAVLLTYYYTSTFSPKITTKNHYLIKYQKYQYLWLEAKILINQTSLINTALYQRWLKLARWFEKKRILKPSMNVFLTERQVAPPQISAWFLSRGGNHTRPHLSSEISHNPLVHHKPFLMTLSVNQQLGVELVIRKNTRRCIYVIDYLHQNQPLCSQRCVSFCYVE